MQKERDGQIILRVHIKALRNHILLYLLKINTHIHMYTHTYTYTCMYTHKHICIHEHTHEKTRWMVPEVQHLRLTSGLHTQVHMHAHKHIYTKNSNN